ncbi:PopZ family protein [Bradyrhizobium oligotrophicum]|uniref:PopZ family protein n=1 Tax=Bradyrhizobium oligotrophicum TaxID=44255 RepID=UPI003EB7BA57
MTQPAKVQEPSMEEILASIRRIIADDEGKPPAADKAAAPEPVKAEKPAAPAAKPVMNDIPPSKIAAAAPAKPAPPPPAPPPAAAAAPNSQDDIDALLAGLDETTPAAGVRPAEPEPDPEPEVLELTDDMAVAPPTPAPAPAPAAASFRKVDPQNDIEFIESGRLNQKAASFESSFEQATPKQPILAPSTVNAVESAFNALANTVLSNNARTLEDLVKEMLRPMLKSWLDDNLPALVERIVKAEIERVSRGR